MKTLYALAGLLMLASIQLVDAASATEGADDKTIAKKSLDPDKKICRGAPNSTGSMMPKRICHSRAEWAEIDTVEKDDSGQRRALERARMSSGSNR